MSANGEPPRSRASAADIVVSPEPFRRAGPVSTGSATTVLLERLALAEPRSSRSDAELFRRLRRLKDRSGSNKNEQVIT